MVPAYGGGIICRAQHNSAETGAIKLHPFDDWGVIYGQGTCGVEMCAQVCCCACVCACMGVGALLVW